jgi:hypothetical protein
MSRVARSRKEHEAFHPQIEERRTRKRGWLSRLLREFEFRDRVMAVVLVLKIFLVPARFVEKMPCAHSRGSARLLQWNAVPEGAAGRASGSTYFVVKRVPRLSCVNW